MKGKVNSKSKGVNYDENMDRGTMNFISSVSLPKDSKQLCWVNKLQMGNCQNYKCTAMVIMLLESKRLNHMGITLIQVDRLFIRIYSLIIHLEISIQNISQILSFEPHPKCKPKATDKCFKELGVK